jgi:hypothetical protein
MPTPWQCKMYKKTVEIRLLRNFHTSKNMRRQCYGLFLAVSLHNDLMHLTRAWPPSSSFYQVSFLHFWHGTIHPFGALKVSPNGYCLSVHTYRYILICMLHMYATYVCYICMLHMYATYVCYICMLPTYVCYICMLHMYATYVCYICMLPTYVCYICRYATYVCYICMLCTNVCYICMLHMCATNVCYICMLHVYKWSKWKLQ